ncbi:MAG: hypothetical protein ACRETI_06955 [Steroidobacteraceae bacterium]
MVQQAISQLVPDVNFKFLDKDYEKDVYVREPITGKKVRTSCVRFRATSGFQFKMDPPQHALTTRGLTVTQNIAKIKHDGLTFKFMLGPCAWVAAGFGVQLTDVRFVFKARPTLSFDGQGACRLAFNADPSGIAVSIGDLNMTGVQNNLDGLAKKALVEGINNSLDTFLGTALRGALQQAVAGTCGGQPKSPVRIR